MKQLILSPLIWEEWKETRDTLQKYCRLVGAIRETLSRPLPCSLHTNLLIYKNGFTTSLIPKNEQSPDQLFEVIIDLIHKRLRIESNYREPLYIALTGQSLNALCDETCSLLTDIGIKPPLERPSFLEGHRGMFDSKQVKTYWDIASKVNRIMKKMRSELKGEITPVQLRPDDLNIFFARYNSEAGNNAHPEEQIEFGFSTGDEFLREAYFYIATFPDTSKVKMFFKKENRIEISGKPQRAVLPYSKLIKDNDSENLVTEFFNCVKKHFVDIKSANI